MRVLVSALLTGLFAAGIGEGSEIAPGAVVQGDDVFLTAADGTLVAHAASTGVRRWSSSAARRPLAAYGGRLLAQAPSDDGLRLVVLDVATGRRLEESSVPLPYGVTAPLDDTGDTRFIIRIEQDGPRVRLDWTWEFRPMRGTFDEGGDDGSHRNGGAELVELPSGRVTHAAPRHAGGPERLPAALAREADAGAFLQRPLRVGQTLVTTQAVPGAVLLKRWSLGGAAMPDVTLPDGVTLQLGSADGRHVLVSRELAGEPFEAAHEWTVVAIDTGASVATLRAPTAAAAFAVTGARVLMVQQAGTHRTAAGLRSEPRRVDTFDRASGARSWTQEIRDTSYRGPVAP